MILKEHTYLNFLYIPKPQFILLANVPEKREISINNKINANNLYIIRAVQISCRM